MRVRDGKESRKKEVRKLQRTRQGGVMRCVRGREEGEII